MKHLLSILLALTCFTANAATVTGNLIDLFGENAGGTITFSNTLGAQIIGTTINVSKPKSVALTSGAFTNILVTGNYLVTAGGHQFRINVPSGSGEYRIEALATNLVTYTYTNIALMDVAAGSGVTVATNGLLRTISSNADLSSATNNDTVIATGLTNQITANSVSIAANTSSLNGKVAIANNGTDFANRLLTASNISVITISNQTELPAIPNISGITGKYPGQPLVTYGGGTGGGGIHQLYFWNTNGGVANWDGGLMVPGLLVAYASGANHRLYVTNGADNCVELRNFDRTHYSAVRWTDSVAGNEKGAMGYGNDQTPYYTGYNYLEDFGNQQGFYFADNGLLRGGLWRFGATGNSANGKFVWFDSSASTDAVSHVVFSIDQSGNVKAKGEAGVNSLVVTNTVVLGSGPGAAITLAGTNITIANSGSANLGQGSFSKLTLNGTGTTVCSPALNFSPVGFGFAMPTSTTWDAGYCNGTVTTNMHIDRVANTLYLQNAVTIGVSNTLPAAGVSLDLTSTNQAMILNRLTKAARDGISVKYIGMVIFQTDNTPGVRTWNGANWMRYTETAD